MRLHIYNITDGKTEIVGEMLLAPHHRVDSEDRDVFVLPANPESMLLDVYHEEEGYMYPKYSDTFSVDEFGYPSNVVYVSSVEELINAADTGASICIKKGKYNISEYIESLSAKEIKQINDKSPVVKLRECHDGYEVVFENAMDLRIFGETGMNEDVEFVTDYRYATVFCFENCYNVDLSGMKLGHTEMGECDGDVLNFIGTSRVFIDGCDLYGCGVYGIVADGYSGDFYVSDTTIHHCQDGPLYIDEGLGDYTFFDCEFSGSNGYSFYRKSPEADLYFYNCTFGQHETESFMFHEDVISENCIWSEDIEYPEYGYENDELTEALNYFEPEIMEMIPFEKESLDDTYWNGYMKVVQESGYTVYFPEYSGETGEEQYTSVELLSDGNAYIQHGGESLTGKWYCYDNDSYTVRIEINGGYNGYVSLFAMPDDADARAWMMLQLGEDIIWLY